MNEAHHNRSRRPSTTTDLRRLAGFVKVESFALEYSTSRDTRAMSEPSCLAPLRNLDSSEPKRIRRQALGALTQLTNADGALFFKYARHDETDHYTAIEIIGPDEMVALAHSMEGMASMSGDFWNPCTVPADERDCFVSMHYDPELLDQTRHPTLRMFYTAFGVHAQMRALIYQGARFIGWLGCWRQRNEPFEDRILAKANDNYETFATALIAAENAAHTTRLPGELLFDPEGDQIEYASEGVSEWLSDERRERLTELIEGAEDGHTLPPVAILDGSRVRLVRMRGAAGLRYLVTMRPCDVPRLGPLSLLTPRQREVAEYAAAGATAREIARHLELSPATVRDHIKSIYERLDISNRTELVLALSDRLDIDIG